MTESTQDQWTQWLLHQSFGGDPQHMKTMLESLSLWRNQILQHAHVSAGETVLDIGCGNGLVAFGALDLVGEQGKVVFSDISQHVLRLCSSLAYQMLVLDRCEFLQAAAEDLSALATASVDVVTIRSVLIYVEAKQQAFHEMYRVLKPNGRLSIFEPINSFRHPEPPHIFMGYDVTPIQEIASKVRAVLEQEQSPERDPVLNFDERDLLTFAEQAGFAEIHMELQITIKQPTLLDQLTETIPSRWEMYLKSSENPSIPALEEAMTQALSPQEAQQFTAYLRPLIETMQPRERQALAYLWAVKR